MSIKNILVAYNGTREAESALAVACLMAQKYDAYLTGILTHGLPTVLYSYGSHLPQSAMDQLEDADREHRAEVRKSFETATINLNSDKVQYLDVFGEVDEKLMEIACTYDIVVMGVGDRDSQYQHMEIHPDVVTRNSGRPVLVVPADYRTEILNEKALLAWDGHRAAARAMADSLSILETESVVTVLTVADDEVFAEKTGPVMQHLSRHGIQATAMQKTKSRGGIATAILDAIDETNSGILVMGAYEHSKLAEDLFGGVTNTILRKSRIPVLLSH